MINSKTTKLIGICLLFFVFISTSAIAKDLTPEQQQTITGKVTDQSGTPMPGVNVKVKGTTTGTITSEDGSFTLLASSNSTLVFSFIGYLQKEVLASTALSSTVILREDVTSLDEVVVIGYGTQKKKGFDRQRGNNKK